MAAYSRYQNNSSGSRLTAFFLFVLIILPSNVSVCDKDNVNDSLHSRETQRQSADDGNKRNVLGCRALPNPYLYHGRIEGDGPNVSVISNCANPNGDEKREPTKYVAFENTIKELGSSELANSVQSVNDSLYKDFKKWKFASQKLLRQFSIDKEERNFVRQVPGAIFSRVLPTSFKTNIKMVVASSEVIRDILDIHPDVAESELFVAFASGNTYLEKPLAHRYGGHQFGSWAGQLGDGRAHLLGEYVNSKEQRWELQLKGSGLTPYSRRGDGKAVIRSSVREFLASEAMFHLGIPTSRAASLIISDDPVWRDQFYDGHPRKERAAVVLRLAPSWFRIGSMEILAKSGEIGLLRYSVMNTDNFSILSITIDYGPFGFLDGFDQGFVPNSSDDEGMYSIGNQATVGQYNLEKFRDALIHLLDSAGVRRSQEIIAEYSDKYHVKLMSLFREKLGLKEATETSDYLVALLLQVMEENRSDFTMTFRQLGELSLNQLANGDIAKRQWALVDLQDSGLFKEWVRLYVDQFSPINDEVDLERRRRMNAVNPRYILRNWMAHQVIEEVEADDFEGLKRLHNILKNPFTEQEEAEALGYSARPPPWARKIRVSCSS